MKISNVKKKMIPIFSMFVILLIVVAMLLGNSSTVLADEVTSDANTTKDYCLLKLEPSNRLLLLQYL